MHHCTCAWFVFSYTVLTLEVELFTRKRKESAAGARGVTREAPPREPRRRTRSVYSSVAPAVPPRSHMHQTCTMHK